MTAVADRFAVRVMVTDVWDQVFLAVGPDTTVADLKRQALVEHLGATELHHVRPGIRTAAFIVLPARRQPVQ